MTTPRLLTWTELKQKPQAITTAAGGGKFLTREDVDDYYDDHPVYMKFPTGPSGLLPSSKTQKVGVSGPNVKFVPWKSGEPENKLTFEATYDSDWAAPYTTSNLKKHSNVEFSPFGAKDAGILKFLHQGEDPQFFHKMPFMCFADGQGSRASLVYPAQSNPNRPACRWLSYDSAVKCCTLPYGQKDKFGKVCDPSYTTGGGKCTDVMVKHCAGRWDSPECSQFLHDHASHPNAAEVVERTIKNYLQAPNRLPQQYTTPAISGRDVGRDDSKDKFLQSDLPFLCNAVPGACDTVLDQYCSLYTVEQLNADPTLQRICGCHLSNGTKPPDAGFTDDTFRHFWQPQQYRYSGIEQQCHPICRFANTVERGGAPCASTVCIVDDVTINQKDSNGDINIEMNCGGCKEGSCSTCSISDVVVNEIDTNGRIILKQDCGSCFIFDHENPDNVVRVDCGTLNPDGTPCDESTPCPDGYKCINGKCLKDVECDDEYKCDPPLVCDNGKCVECSVAYPCPQGYVCVNGQCQEPDDRCASDADCPAGQHCVAGACVDNLQCQSDADCPNGKCKDGKCVKKEFPTVTVAIVGGIVLLVLIALTVFIISRRRKTK